MFEFWCFSLQNSRFYKGIFNANPHILINLILFFLKEKSRDILAYNLIVIKGLLKRINKKERRERERESRGE
jgi:hypothetical protein